MKRIFLFLVIVVSFMLAGSLVNASQMYVVNSGNSTVSRANLDGTGGVSLGNPTGTLVDPFGIAIDPAAGKMYVTSRNFARPNLDSLPIPNSVIQANLDGSGGVSFGDLGGTLDDPVGIAIDPTAGKMYVVNRGNSTVSRANLDGSGGVNLGDPTGGMFTSPHYIAIDPAAGKMYVTYPFSNTIFQANLDGNGGVSLGDLGGGMGFFPVGIAIDPAASKMYVTDVGQGTVFQANLDGSGGVSFGDLGGTLDDPWGIAIDPAAGKMYVTNRGNNRPNLDSLPIPNTVIQANLDGSGGVSLGNLGGTLNDPMGIALELGFLPPTPPNPCQYTFSQSNPVYDYQGGTGSITFSFQSGNCTAGTPTSDSSWLTITSGTAPMTSGTITYRVAPYNGSTPRIGHISAGDINSVITQNGPVSVTCLGLDFGTVQTGQPVFLPCALTNNLNRGILVTQATFTSATSPDYSLSYLNSLIGTDESCIFTLLLTPSTVGTKQGTLNVTFDAAEIAVQVFNLTGTGQTGATPTIQVTPQQIDITRADLDWGNGSRDLMIKNIGTSSLDIGEIKVAGTDEGNFSLVHSCRKLEPNQSCLVTVKANWIAYRKVYANLAIISNDRNQPVITVPLTADVGDCNVGTVITGTSSTAPVEGTSGSLSVSTGSACWWTAVSNTAWISVNSPTTTVQGNGSVSYTVKANTDKAVRFGTIQVGERQYSIVQYGTTKNQIYSDTAGSPYTDYIEAITAKGITTGCGSGKYCPTDPVTREQVAAFIIRAKEGDPSQTYCSTGAPFLDVATTDWSCSYIKRLSERHITLGCGGGLFCPSDPVSRGQAAAFIVRAIYGENFSYTLTPYFSDVPPTNPTFKYIQKLKDEGITVAAGTFGVNTPVTRAQMAAFLARAFLGMQ